MYAIIPVNNGEMDSDYSYHQEVIQVSATQCYAKLRDDAPIRESWQIITEEQFNQVKPVVIPPPVTPVTLEELKNNQLILMNAIADLYETIIGGN